MEHKVITRNQAMGVLQLQKSQTFATLNKMIDKKLLDRRGLGPGTYYELNQED